MRVQCIFLMRLMYILHNTSGIMGEKSLLYEKIRKFYLFYA